MKLKARSLNKEHELEISRDGRVVTADENYVRESILTPGAKIVSGFKPIMPVFQGLVSEEQLNALVAYVKSQSQPGPGPPSAGFLRVMVAVFSSFLGIRKKAAGERDMVTLKPLHVILAGLLTSTPESGPSSCRARSSR